MSAITANTSRTFRLALIGLLALSLFAVFHGRTSRAQIASQPWSRIGSDATIDESRKDNYDVNGVSLRVLSAGDVTARYNVEPVEGLFATGDKTFLRVSFRDNGPGSRVRLALWQTPVFAGTQTALLRFDSDAFPAGYAQVQEVSNCPGFTFDFDNNVYWIEAFLEKVGNAPSPRLFSMQIGQTEC